MRPRSLCLVACSAAVLWAGSPAVARAPLHVRVASFDLVQVNQEVVRVKPGGSHPLCQAIPVIAIRVRVRWSGAHGFPEAQVWLKPPGRRARSRSITLSGSSGTEPVEFTPRSADAPGGAFAGGRYIVRITRRGRTQSSTSLTFTEQTKTC